MFFLFYCIWIFLLFWLSDKFWILILLLTFVYIEIFYFFKYLIIFYYKYKYNVYSYFKIDNSRDLELEYTSVFLLWLKIIKLLAYTKFYLLFSQNYPQNKYVYLILFQLFLMICQIPLQLFQTIWLILWINEKTIKDKLLHYYLFLWNLHKSKKIEILDKQIYG